MPGRHRSSQMQDPDIGGLLHDQAFEPRSSFHFEDEMSSIESDINSFNAFDGQSMGFQPVDGMFDENIDHALFQSPDSSFSMGATPYAQGQTMPNVDTVNMFQDKHSAHGMSKGFGRSGAHPQPPSAQSEIVRGRSNRVTQQFGQITPRITPPEEGTPESMAQSSTDASNSSNSQQEATAKFNRSQRARNAANKRHSKTKKTRKDSGHADRSEGEADEDAQGKNTNLQREKNRIAAAKCRAKKKVNSEEMQDNHRESARRNSFLHREMRALRDQKAFLLNSLLQHEPGVCKCHTIHRFNLAQAQQMALGVGATLMGTPMSPSLNSASPVQSPGSEASAGRRYRMSSVSAPAGRADMMANPSTFDSPPNYGFAPTMLPDSGMSHTGTPQDGSHMTQHFAEFLHGSPDGRAGFS